MQLSNLKLFNEVAKHGNITKAAQEAHITQPAMSKVIAKLEGDIGCKLFERHPNRVELNQCGEIVLDAYNQIMQVMSDMRHSLDAYTSGKGGKVRIATTFPTFNTVWINRCLKKYRQTHENVIFDHTNISNDRIPDALKNQEIDFAVSDYVQIDNKIEWHELYQERIALLVSKDSPWANKGVISLRDVKNENFVSYAVVYPYSSEKDYTYSLCKMAGFKPNVVFRGGFREAVECEVAEGRGLLFMLEHNCKKLVEENLHPWHSKLTYCSLKEDFCCRSYSIAKLKDRVMSPAAQDLYNAVVNADYFE